MDTQRSFKAKQIVVSLAAAGIVVLGAASSWHTGQAAPMPAAPMVPAATAPAAPQAGAMALPDFSSIASRYGPAVVNISVTGVSKELVGSADEGPVDPQLQNDPFYQFFRRFMGPNGMLQQREVPVRGEGSGFIVDPSGIILTNAHVVRDAKEVMVKLTDRREFRAKVLGSDAATDVAVLKIDANNLPVVPLGNDKTLEVGQWVLAIGSPFGFMNSVTAGVVSAKGRSLPDEGYVPFIQTDVAVNPGNSGGPLFNTQGQVVGINSQIYSRTGGYEGLSFAIPIDLAVHIRDQILAHGKVEHAKLGVTVQDVNQALADSFKLDKPEGALVSSVEKGSAADRAGLESGDVITRIDGHPIVEAGDLSASIGLAEPGRKVTLQVWRDGRSRDVVATLGKASETVAQSDGGKGASQGRLGLAVRPLQPQERREGGIDHGLVIEDAEGPAALAGIHSGDVLLAVDGTPVNSVAQLRALLAKSGKSMALLIQRGHDKIFVPVQIG